MVYLKEERERGGIEKGGARCNKGKVQGVFG
jgi:hypothetical protein